MTTATTRTRSTRHARARTQTRLPTTIGERLRASRKAQRITLVELAKSSSVDAATISRVERGTMTGTLECHMKLARALGIKFSELYAGIEDAQAVRGVSHQVIGARSEVYVHQAGKSSLAMLTSDVLKKKLMPVLISIEPGGSTNKEEARMGTEKFLYVLEGELEATVGPDTHTLKKGSSLYFEASLPHRLRNSGSKPVRCLAVTTPPAL